MPKRKWLGFIGYVFLLVTISQFAAWYAVRSNWYWAFIHWLPTSLTRNLGDALYFLTKPILVNDAQSAEEQLDFFQAWLLCALALCVIICFIACIRQRRAATTAKKGKIDSA